MRFFVFLLILFVATRIRKQVRQSLRSLDHEPRSDQLVVTGYRSYAEASHELSEQLGISMNEVQERINTLPALMVSDFDPQTELETLAALDRAGVECWVADPATPVIPITTTPKTTAMPRPERPAQPETTSRSRKPLQVPPKIPLEASEHDDADPPSARPDEASAPAETLTWSTQDLNELSAAIANALGLADPQAVVRALRRESLNGDHGADTALGIFFIEHDRLDDAEAAFRARAYDDPVAANNLGCLAFQAGKPSAAKRHFSKAAEMGSPEAVLNLDFLTSR